MVLEACRLPLEKGKSGGLLPGNCTVTQIGCGYWELGLSTAEEAKGYSLYLWLHWRSIGLVKTPTGTKKGHRDPEGKEKQWENLIRLLIGIK